MVLQLKADAKWYDFDPSQNSSECRYLLDEMHDKHLKTYQILKLYSLKTLKCHCCIYSMLLFNKIFIFKYMEMFCKK